MYLSRSGSLVQRVRENLQGPGILQGGAEFLMKKDTASSVTGSPLLGQQLLLHLKGHWPEFQLWILPRANS